MADPIYPEQPDWLSDADWLKLLKHIERNNRLDSQTKLSGVIGENPSRMHSNRPEDIWWEAWTIAVIQSGHKIRPPGRPETVKDNPLTISPERAKKRGPKPFVTERVISEMRKVGIKVVANWTEEAMVAHFHASRDTCRKALAKLESEFVGN